MDYRKLDELNKLRISGALTDEEFEQEKQKILNKETPKGILGLSENSYMGIMNFVLLIPTWGWIISIIAWIVGKDKSEAVSTQGKYIFNWVNQLEYLYINNRTYICRTVYRWNHRGDSLSIIIVKRFFVQHRNIAFRPFIHLILCVSNYRRRQRAGRKAVEIPAFHTFFEMIYLLKYLI